MRRALLTGLLWVVILTAIALPSFAQKPTFGSACGGKATVKIFGPQSLYVICGKAWTPSKDGAIDSAVKLYEVPTAAANDPAISNTFRCDANRTDEPGGGSFSTIWKVTLTGLCNLTGRKFYQLRLVWVPPEGEAQPASVAFATKGEATISNATASIDSGRVLALDTNSQVRLKPQTQLNFSVFTDGGIWKQISGASPNLGGQAFSRVGHIEVTLPFEESLSPGKYRVRVANLVGAVGEDIEVDDGEKVEVSSTRGTAKDDVVFYAKFGHQAGEKAKSAWSLEAKSEVEIAQRWNHWRLFPMILVDTGFGSAETNDSLKGGLGMRRFFQTSGPLQGYTPSIAAVYETDRMGGKRNLVGAAEVRLYFSRTYNSLAKRNRLALVRKMEATGNYKLTTDDLLASERKRVGYTLQAFLGSEFGGSLYTQQIEFDKVIDGARQNAALDLPPYKVTRFYPKLSAALEIDRLTLSASGIVRYLANAELTGRVLDDKTYVRIDRKGWIGYAEFSAAWQVNSVIAVDVTYKIGGVPPLFKRVNIVQSGLVYHF